MMLVLNTNESRQLKRRFEKALKETFKNSEEFEASDHHYGILLIKDKN